jgi:hypothetical protein
MIRLAATSVSAASARPASSPRAITVCSSSRRIVLRWTSALLGSEVTIYDSDFHDLHPDRRRDGRSNMAAARCRFALRCR